MRVRALQRADQQDLQLLWSLSLCVSADTHGEHEEQRGRDDVERELQQDDEHAEVRVADAAAGKRFYDRGYLETHASCSADVPT